MFVVEMVVFALFLIGADAGARPISGWSCSCSASAWRWAATIRRRTWSSPRASPARTAASWCCGAFAFQAIGALVGTVVGYLILLEPAEIRAWRWMYATAIVPAIVVVLGRLDQRQRPLADEPGPQGRGRSRGRAPARARAAVSEGSARWPIAGRRAGRGGARAPHGGWRELLRCPAARATVLASVPWFLRDLGTYGIGIFTPHHPGRR